MSTIRRLAAATLLWFGFLFLIVFGSLRGVQGAQPVWGTIPSSAPVLRSPNFECNDPERLAPWTIHKLLGDPEIAYARERFLGSCEASGIFEHLESIDSLVILAQDIETPPDPGKPFDIAFSQSFSTTPGVDYSVSGWMLSLCGGSAIPNDCPEGLYMAKLIGLDPTGGSDPLSPQIVWTENRQNFTESRWVNLRTAVRAQAENMTVFARLNSPFLHHGNHGYLDAISVVRSPIAYFSGLPATVAGTTLTLTWESEQSPDISGIQGGAYQLLVDIEARQLPSGEWKTVISDSVGSNSLPYSVKCADSSYQFRIRPRSEQSPDVGPGVFPNQRYPGVWSEPVTVDFTGITMTTPKRVSPAAPIEGDVLLFLPLVSRQVACVE
ncbi:MAG: hypothetical protein U0175_21840 [Caldilineaceae bacterium]